MTSATGISMGTIRRTARGRRTARTITTAKNATIGVREAVAKIPTDSNMHEIHHVRLDLCARANASGIAITKSTPSAIGCSAEAMDLQAPSRRPDCTSGVNRRGRTAVRWSKTLKCVRCSTAAKNATTLAPATNTFVRNSTESLLRIVDTMK